MPAREQLKLSGRHCQCCGCGEYFNGERGFDRNRVGMHGVNRRCLSIAEMIARGWYRNAAGFWAMTRLDGAGRARFRPAQARPAPSPFPETGTPDSSMPAGAA